MEVEEGQKNEYNQLVLLEESSVQRSPIKNPNTYGILNHEAAMFTPRSTETAKSKKKKNNVNPNESGNATAEVVQKELIVQWVNRTFGGNLVPTNHSCQEITSQSIYGVIKLKNALRMGNYQRVSLVKMNQQMRRGIRGTKYEWGETDIQ